MSGFDKAGQRPAVCLSVTLHTGAFVVQASHKAPSVDLGDFGIAQSINEISRFPFLSQEK